MTMEIVMLLVVCLVGGAILIGIIALAITKFYRKVEQGQALIINKTNKKIDVAFTGGMVYPIVHKAETMDISVKAMEVERSGQNGLICADNIRADIRVSFYVRVNQTQEDVLKVAQAVGCKRASTKETLEELFQAKFSEALKTVGKQMEFDTLFIERVQFKEEIIKVIGKELNGYALEDVAIDYLEQTPLESLDPNNIMDAQGIKKIIDKTAEQAKLTNELQRDKERVIKQQDVETKEKVLELEKQQADAEARQKREISVIQSRESAEAAKVQAEEMLKAEKARIASEEEIAVANENKLRQVEVAAKAKERTVAVETERVQRDAQLESVERERLVAIKDIEKEKAVEVEKKKIQDVIRERVMVEKTVAVEQEKIKDTVKIAEAERLRKAEVIDAEREAEKQLIAETKAAESKEKAAKSLYEERVTFAEAERIAAEKQSDAKKIMADGIIAEQAADGLAKVKVREAEANAITVEGEAEAKAHTAKASAQAMATETQGSADAKATEAKMKAEATGTSAKGEAEATAMSAKYSAEADGIDKKADAMKKFDGVGREHEEFKLKLGKEERIELAGIDVQHKIAEAQAKVMAEAMKSADIDIVGGDGVFLDNLFKSISLGKSVDGFVNKSKVANQVLLGDGNHEGLINQVKELISMEKLSMSDIKDLTVSALLGKLALSKNPSVSKQATTLKDAVKDVGDMDISTLMAMWMAK